MFNYLKLFRNMSIVIFIVLSLAFATTVSAESNELEKVYHVYLDGEHIGKVDNKEVVQKIVDEKIAKGKKTYNTYTIVPGKTVSYIPEKVFNPTYNNEKVVEAVTNDVSIKAEAIELKIADKTVGFFTNEKTIQHVLYTYKNKFVSKDVLDNLKTDNKPKLNRPLRISSDEPSLSIGESTVIEVSLSKEVTTEMAKVDPEKISTVKQGVKMLEKGTLEEKKHTVDEGEVLGEIASMYDISTDKLLQLNPNLTEESILNIGEKLHVTEYAPFVNVIVKKEKLVEEAIQHEKEIVESDDLYKGEEQVKQEGSDGEKKVHYAIEMTNGKETSKKVLEETIIKEPKKEIIIRGTKVISSRGTGNLHWPTIGGYVSSGVGMRWGRMHKGMDIARPSNRAILAADNGVVVEAGYDGSFGNKVVINHNNGMKTIYAHMSSILVSPGQTVERGSQIGVMGATGNSTGVHLHFEVHVNGSLKTPADYF